MADLKYSKKFDSTLKKTLLGIENYLDSELEKLNKLSSSEDFVAIQEKEVALEKVLNRYYEIRSVYEFSRIGNAIESIGRILDKVIPLLEEKKK